MPITNPRPALYGLVMSRALLLFNRPGASRRASLSQNGAGTRTHQ